MLNFQTTASSQKKDISSHSQSDNKTQNSGGEDFLATLLKSMKSDESSKTNSQNNSVNTTQNTQEQGNAQNLERLEVNQAEIESEVEKTAGLESLATAQSTDETPEKSVIIEWVDGKPVIKESVITKALSALEIANGGEGLVMNKDSLEKLISIEANLNELKNIKSLEDLIKIADKLDLNLSKFTISKDDLKALKKSFPKLNDINFFKSIESELNKAVAVSKTPNPTFSLASLLKEGTSITHALATAKIQPKQEPKEVKKENNLKSILNDDLIKSQPKTESKAEVKAEIKNEKIEEKPKADFVKFQSETKEPKITPNVIKESIKDDPNKAFDISNYLNAISKKAASAIEASTPQVDSDPAQAELPKTEGVEHNLSENTIKDLVTAIKMQDRFISKELQIQSVRTFAAEMVEKISEFKPPVTRINMQLHPAELGEVNVTMIARANNLHVNITSTNTTMALFLQNQAEFKANLVNMGFSGIEMSFSDHKEGGGGFGEQARKKAMAKDAYEEELGEGETNLEIILPRYI